jgi:Threonine aldolase
MNFGSDNLLGASAPVMEALLKANQGALDGYGADVITRRVEQQLCDLFERNLKAFLVTTGTAANALSLAAAVQPWGMAVSHSEAHVQGDECGAPEFFMHGGKLVGLPGVAGKMQAGALETYLASLPRAIKQMPPQAVTLSQLTEAGTAYSVEEINAIWQVCRRCSLTLHMDGARFANALVALGCSPAEMTWKNGVDILSFGASKNGCLAAEAVIIFKEELVQKVEYMRKRSGHTLSKGRLLAAQFEGYLADGHWLDNARHANDMAAKLHAGLAGIPGVRFPWPVQANEAFPIIPLRMEKALREAGAGFFHWQTESLPSGEEAGKDEVLVRLVTSFATRPEEVTRFVDVARSAAS